MNLFNSIKSRVIPLVFLFMTSCSITSIGTDQPICLHPDNGHYFLWRGQPTILITSGEHYGALLNLDFDYDTYFKTLAKNGLNHTRTFSGTYREVPSSFGITDNPLAPKPDRYICPWKRTTEPGGHNGKGKFDLTQWDEAYFERLQKLMNSARNAGIVVEMTLFCPLYKDELWAASPMNHTNNINGRGNCSRTEVLTLKHEKLLETQLAFVRKIVNELNHFDNLYFEVCNEPYFAGVTTEWQNRIVDEIISTETGLKNKHLISMNIANGRKEIKQPHPEISIFNFHYCVPPVTVEMNYALNKVIGENETGFRGKDDVLYRTEGWDFLMAGGALYNNLDYSFTPQHPDGSLLEYKSPGGGSPDLRNQLRICKDFLYSLDFIHMKPDNSVIAAVSGGLSARALVKTGKVYAIYMHIPIPKNPKKLSDHLKGNITTELTLNLSAGTYRSEWINTLTGELNASEPISHSGGLLKLSSPKFDNDIALRVVNTK